MERKYGVLSNYEPTYLDKMRYWMQDALTPYMGGDAKRAGAFVQDKVMPTAEFLPGVGDAMGIAEAVDEFNQGNYGTAVALGSLAAIGMIPGVGDVAQKAGKKAIRAYHGSPHDFDKFSLEHIGKGEGAQAYGHGLYFAEKEGIARSYRDKLQKAGNPLLDDSGKLSHLLMKNFPEQGGGAVVNGIVYPNAKHVVEGVSQGLIKRGDIPDEVFDVAHEFTIPGRMYEVNINADPNDFLDWDKPLSEQPEAVRKALGDIGPDAIGVEALGYEKAKELLPPEKQTGIDDLFGWETALQQNLPPEQYQQVLDEIKQKALENTRGSHIAQTYQDRLKEAGIPGIKYLDAGSRGAGDGSRNYVVFDDALIEILRKYGLAGLGIGVGAGGFGSLAPQDENYQPPVL